MPIYVRLLVVLFVLWSIWSALTLNARCETAPPQEPVPPQLEITLSTSRPQVGAGVDFGVAADVKNVSNKEVYLMCTHFVMIPPIEIDPNGPEDWWALIQGNQPPPGSPTWTSSPEGSQPKSTQPGDPAESQLQPIVTPAPAPTPEPFYTYPIRLGPGDKTVAAWTGNSRPSPPSNETWKKSLYRNLRDFIHVLTFAPGDYTIKIVALYWPDPQSARNYEPNYRSQTADIKVSVSAPQWVIIIGASVGGIIAYFLFPGIRRKPNEVEIVGLLSAVLLSAIITILFARISETEFLVKITVSDLWGAIAVGFIAVASGNSLLDKYVSSWGSTKREA